MYHCSLQIGRIYFDPKLGASGCGTDCYVGLSTNIPGTQPKNNLFSGVNT